MKSWVCFTGLVVVSGLAARASDLPSGPSDPLLDWSAWERHFGTNEHPCVTFKPADVARAKANISRHGWAKNHAARVESSARRYLDRLTPALLADMIPETTPGDPLWTPCPACRDQGKPVHPHGLWTWSFDQADQITCSICGTVFPNDKYPEDVVLHTRWGKPQTIRYHGGEPFVIFGYKTGRPSFTANNTGYWSAGRAGGVGMESGFVRQMVEAYDFTCAATDAGGAPIYTTDQRRRIERDLLCWRARFCSSATSRSTTSRSATAPPPRWWACASGTRAWCVSGWRVFIEQSMADSGVLEVSTSAGGARITGHFAAASVQDEKLVWTFVEPDPTSAAATPGGEGASGGD